MLHLQKTAESIKLNLTKKGVANIPAAEVAFVLDVSGSFDYYHRSGITQKLMDKLVPWALVFDPDKRLDVVTFATRSHHVGTIDLANFDSNYIEKSIVDRVEGYNGGTNYAPAIKECLTIFGWGPAHEKAKPSTTGLRGFFNKITGNTPAESNPAEAKAVGRRTIVLFVTDGDNNDHDETMALLKESESRGDQVYFLLVGVGNDNFRFLNLAAEKFSNTGFVKVKDINAFTKQTDDQISEAFIGTELIEWLKK